ncbi:MAG: orotate phosphoribosyltransferase [Actinomycetota bacterium]
MTDTKQAVLDLIVREAHERRDEAFQLSSGDWSHDYIDGKRAISSGPNLRLAADAIIETCRAHEVEFDAVGGLTMGADPLAHAVSLIAGVKWFTVRKEPKKHGKQKDIEGAELTAGEKVLLVEDVITTGRSILKALDAVEPFGVQVVLAVALVDRGDGARVLLEGRGVKYAPILTYADLGIDPVGLVSP